MPFLSVCYRLAPEVHGDVLATDTFTALSWLAGQAGDLDIFRDEDISYAQRLSAAGVPIELHVHPGAPHGFDRLAPGSALTRRAMADRVRVLRNRE